MYLLMATVGGWNDEASTMLQMYPNNCVALASVWRDGWRANQTPERL